MHFYLWLPYIPPAKYCSTHGEPQQQAMWVTHMAPRSSKGEGWVKILYGDISDSMQHALAPTPCHPIPRTPPASPTLHVILVTGSPLLDTTQLALGSASVNLGYSYVETATHRKKVQGPEPQNKSWHTTRTEASRSVHQNHPRSTTLFLQEGPRPH